MPCQDAGHYVLVGDALVGIVCDGAGSASHGRDGALFMARTTAQLLEQALHQACPAAPAPDALGTLLRDTLHEARTRLAALADAAQRELRDYACTMVGCLVTPAAGCFFHIGDGFGVYRRDGGAGALSPPENGEYADQTYFVTEAGWAEHLRLTPLPAPAAGDLIGLMTDGTAPFAINRRRDGFFAPFIDPVAAYLCKAGQADGERALLGLLADEKTCAITSDDKTLLLALAV